MDFSTTLTPVVPNRPLSVTATWVVTEYNYLSSWPHRHPELPPPCWLYRWPTAWPDCAPTNSLPEPAPPPWDHQWYIEPVHLICSIAILQQQMTNSPKAHRERFWCFFQEFLWILPGLVPRLTKLSLPMRSMHPQALHNLRPIGPKRRGLRFVVPKARGFPSRQGCVCRTPCDPKIPSNANS